MNHRIGTVDLPPRLGMDRYFKELGALELSATFSSPLKISLINRWKTEAAEGSLALAAPWVVSHRKAPPGTKGWTPDSASGEFRDSPAVRTALELFGKTCEELKPWAVVFTSPNLFSPSAANRDKLRHFFSEVAPAERFAGAKRVWVPDGLWESPSAVRFATELGITCAVDPLVTIPGTPADLHYHYDTTDLYFRVLAIGRNRGLREDDFITLEEMSSLYEDAAFIFASMERWKDAKNLLKRLGEEPTEIDPIERMTRRSGGEALAFQRPVGAAAAAAVAASGIGALDDEEEGDSDLEEDDDSDEELEDTSDFESDEDDEDEDDSEDDDEEDDE